MQVTKHFCRFICAEEMSQSDIIEYFDIVQSIASTKMVVAYDQEGDSIEAQVIVMDAEDGQIIHEILLDGQIDLNEGEQISDLLNEEFDFDFDFETSLEI